MVLQSSKLTYSKVATGLLNNFFAFNEEIKQKTSRTAIGAKFTALCACIDMDKRKTDFLKTQDLQPFILPHYIGNIFFIWTHGES